MPSLARSTHLWHLPDHHAIGVIFGIFTNPAYTIPEIWDHFGSMHPSGTPIWSFMFITVACGAISGFHSTSRL